MESVVTLKSINNLSLAVMMVKFTINTLIYSEFHFGFYLEVYELMY